MVNCSHLGRSQHGTHLGSPNHQANLWYVAAHPYSLDEIQRADTQVPRRFRLWGTTKRESGFLKSFIAVADCHRGSSLSAPPSLLEVKTPSGPTCASPSELNGKRSIGAPTPRRQPSAFDRAPTSPPDPAYLPLSPLPRRHRQQRLGHSSLPGRPMITSTHPHRLPSAPSRGPPAWAFPVPPCSGEARPIGRFPESSLASGAKTPLRTIAPPSGWVGHAGASTGTTRTAVPCSNRTGGGVTIRR
jgi:hypothetical protein